MKLNRKLILLMFLCGVLALTILFRGQIRGFIKSLPFVEKLTQQKTVEEQIQTYGEKARQKLTPLFASKNLLYPPQRTTFVAIKDERMMEVYVTDADGKVHFLNSYPILGASGVLGPKLREGDLQVPEGLYSLSLEPNTPYHLALRLNYPNPHDWERAKEDGRANPGSDILVHGSDCSIGCLAMGDDAIEELFTIAYDSKEKDWLLLITPVDWRKSTDYSGPKKAPAWLPKLYSDIKQKLSEFPKAD